MRIAGQDGRKEAKNDGGRGGGAGAVGRQALPSAAQVYSQTECLSKLLRPGISVPRKFLGKLIVKRGYEYSADTSEVLIAMQTTSCASRARAR